MIARNENQAEAVVAEKQEYDPLKDAELMQHITERARTSIGVYAPKIQRKILRNLLAELPQAEKELREESEEFDRAVAEAAVAEMEAGIAKYRNELLDYVKMLLAGKDFLVEDLVAQLKDAEDYLQQPMVEDGVE